MINTRIALFSDRRDTVPTHCTTTLYDLSCTHTHDERRDKDGPLFSPAEYRDGSTRGNAGILRLHLLVLDLDHLLHEHAQEVLERLLEAGLEAWIYSTYSYDEHASNGASLRVVLSLSRPVETREWPAFWAQALHDHAPEADPACKDPARIYYLPSCRPGAPRLSLYSEGVPVDVDAVLARASGAAGRQTITGDGVPVARRLVAPPIDDDMREWAEKRLRDLARVIERAPCPGPIYPTLNQSAFACGRFIPHVLDRDHVRQVLHDAHVKRNPETAHKNDAILDRALADGTAIPWRPARPYELTDEGLSQRLLDEHGDHLRYVDQWGKWLGYDGSRWALAGDAAPAMLAMRDLTAALRDEAEYVGGARGKALTGAARKLASASGASNVVRMASPLPKFRVRVEDLDPAPYLLNCANGVVDLTNGTLHEHHASHFMTASTRLVFDPEATCPRWDRFVAEVCREDLDLVLYLQRAIGYTLTSSTAEQCLFFLYGDGANGKSTLLTVLQRLLGEYGNVCSADLILAKKHEQHPTAIAALHGRRLAVVGEVDDGRSWDEALIKNLTGSDMITARRMREDHWSFVPKHKFWIAGNYRPSVRGIDNGIWRRMHLIPFEADFRNQEDKHLGAKLARELPGVLAWAVRGALAWQREGLEMPASVRAATAAYRDEQNFFANFIEESIDIDRPVEERLSRAQVAQLYAQWAIRSGAPVLGARAIAERMGRLAGAIKSNGTQYWTGVRVRPRNHGIISTAN